MAISIDDIYEKIVLVHSGNASKIWKVHDKITHDIFILKEIHRLGLPYDRLKEINDRLIPKVQYSKESEGITYVVEEYIQGRTLAQDVHKLNEQQIIDYGIALCDGLNLLHKQNIIHRDIKPSNIMITTDGNLKLIDFDAARIYKENNVKDTCFIGTTSFAPPELLNEGQTDRRSDIYSLGVTFKALIVSGYKGNIDKITKKCTEHNPNDRYQDVNQLKKDLLKLKGKRNNRLTLKKAALIVGMIVFVGIGSLVFIGEATHDSENTEMQQQENQIEGDKDSTGTQSTPVNEKDSAKRSYKHFLDIKAGFSFDYPDSAETIKQQDDNNGSSAVRYTIKLPGGSSVTIGNLFHNSQKYKSMIDGYKKEAGWEVDEIHAINANTIERRRTSVSYPDKHIIERIYEGKPYDGADSSINMKYDTSGKVIMENFISLEYVNNFSKTDKDIWEHMVDSFVPGLT